MVGITQQVLLSRRASSGVTETSAAPSGTDDFTPGFTFFDRAWAVNNGNTVFRFGFALATAETRSVKLAQRTSANNMTILVVKNLVHTGGGGFEYVDLDTPYDIPGSGDYYIGVYMTGTRLRIASTSRIFKSGDQGLGASAGWTEDSGPCPATCVTY